MREVTEKVYSFNELSEDTQEKVLNNLRDINVGYEWWEFMFLDAANIGLKITSFDLDRNRHAKGDFMLSAAEVAANIISEHGEQCETYKTAQAFLDEHNPVFAEYMDESSEHYESYEYEQKLQEIEAEFLSSLLEDYSIMLQKECEYLCSDEAIIETIEANEYEFYENGDMF